MSWDGTVVAVNGVVGAQSISVFDRGFLYGDSVFEVFRTYKGLPHALGAHLNRLNQSANAIGMPASDSALLRRELRQALEHAQQVAPGERRVRLVVTRGDDGAGVAPGAAGAGTRVILASPLKGHPEHLYQEGAGVLIVSGQASGIPGAKVGNYLPSVLATGEARRRGAHEALLCDAGGFVREGATSNVFLIAGSRLITPPLEGILPGVTRSVVLGLAKDEGLDVEERAPHADEVRCAEGIFLTSTVRGLMPVVRVDGQRLGDGRPHPTWERLRSRFVATLDARLGWD